MSNKNEIRDEQTILISELLIKVTALENAIVAKGLINNIDIATETKKIVSKLTELVQQNIMDETKKNSGN
jgi:hypothetical protein